MIQLFYDKEVKDVIRFLQLLQVPVSSTTVNTTLQNHPDYPSLLAVGDALKDWKIDNGAVHTTEEYLYQLPTPFITTFTGKDASFIIVQQATEAGAQIQCLINGKTVTLPANEFFKKWSKIVLLVEKSNLSGEKDFAKHQKAEKIADRKLKLSVAACFMVIVAACLPVFFQAGALISKLSFSGYVLLHTVGLLTSALLLWYEVDKSNPVVQQFCSGSASSKTNCNAVLSSKQSKLFNLVSWSEIGFFYFCGGLLALLFGGFSFLPAIAWLGILASPYIIFSVFYQAKIAKQWCPMCLTVQAVLFLEALTGISTGALSLPLDFALVFTPALLLCFVLPVFIWYILKPNLLKAQENKRTKTQFNRLKYNDELFYALLKQQKQVTTVEDLGISIGNPQAANTIIKVCNPYCGPCASAHPEIEALIENNKNVKAQILFTATGDEKDIRTPPAKHLLAIAAKDDEQLTKQALDDWYLAEKKDYAAFAAKYPMNGELQQQDKKIEVMDKWCNENDIRFTPTFFVGLPSPLGEGQGVRFYQLPEQYSITDLKYFLFV
jgi:uncharacterized membrane protein/thiol-disulfide isomerase/thioredoxin